MVTVTEMAEWHGPYMFQNCYLLLLDPVQYGELT